MQSINMELAQYSELFMLISAFIYTAAFMLFAVDMIRSSATIRRVEAELAAENAAERELVGAEPAAGAAASAGGGAEARTGAEQPVAAAPAEELVDDEMAYLGTSRPFANIAVALTVLAVAAHTFAVAARGIAANRVPWANMYEFLVTGALVVAAVYLLVLTRKDVRFLGTFALGLVVTMMAAATIGFPTPLAHVQPALQSPWIAIHVSLAVLAISLFTLTFAMNVLQLIQHRRELTQAAGETTRGSGWQFLRLVPSATSLENWAYRMNALGFVFWTLGPLITGAIWAEETWGRYWGWDVKEVWTFVIWVVYAGYLHARATRGWTGNRAAWLSIIGYGCIIFNYAVVNVYFPGLHSYAGLPQ
ncbi:c-type cytochrome biogenesis protein CcsB [Nesterenkonia sp. E16_7]|uniref:c-type cytochrome biogenesis protein CcsB n=1 Tax=unclassified Nesterenkonia TaxID=2629769 RepID=UPI001A92BF1C|nr:MULTISPECIES: c-type cytochrome biogenesis protein CcsB [unclassified Nesterenkonia]MBO0596967.1 c-type cytochrome biogenesis protein CcsB [Nesterenkonia sp. E16_10]MBO0598395.1 c-type cytochrome biogenesis protein CcsB [Nesterenkonia sp. E16_7]